MVKKPCVGMPFILAAKTTLDLTRAESFSFWYKRPDDTAGTIVATESTTQPGRITGLVTSAINDDDQAGEWRVRLLIKWDYDDNPAKGKICKFVVNAEDDV